MGYPLNPSSWLLHCLSIASRLAPLSSVFSSFDSILVTRPHHVAVLLLCISPRAPLCHGNIVVRCSLEIVGFVTVERCCTHIEHSGHRIRWSEASSIDWLKIYQLGHGRNGTAFTYGHTCQRIKSTARPFASEQGQAIADRLAANLTSSAVEKQVGEAGSPISGSASSWLVEQLVTRTLC